MLRLLSALLIVGATLAFADPPPMPTIGSGQTLGSTPGFGGTEAGKQWGGTISTTTPAKKEITGRCVLSSEESSNIEIPCPNVSLSFQRSDGKEISRTVVIQGHFVCPVPVGSNGFFKVKSDKYLMVSRSGPYRPGDDVIVRLEALHK